MEEMWCGVHNAGYKDTSKTKEMVLGRLANTNLPLPNIASQTVEKSYYVQVAWCAH